MSSNAEIAVHIRNIAFGGEGVGEVVSQADGGRELLGISAFIPFTAPGEIVTARIEERKERYVRGALLTIQSRSKERVEPLCKYFSICGGCELQHLSYEEQLRAKQEMIRGALQAGKVSQEVLLALRPIEGGEPYGYRRRISLHIDRSGKIGFYRANSRSIVPIESCAIAIPEFSPLLKELPAFGREVAGKVSSLILDADREGIVAVLKAPYALNRNEQKVLLESARKYFESCVLLGAGEELGGFGRQILELPLDAQGSFSIAVPAGNFSQVNEGINQRLVQRVLEYAQPSRQTTALDLYAGAGNFSLPLARAGAKVRSVESDKRLVVLGRESIAKYRLERELQFIESSVERFLQSPQTKVDVLIADPPRSGLRGITQQLPKANSFILISCHLASFVRDLRSLLELGYSVEEIQPFDMFAQTSYTEIVAKLTRSV